MANITALSDEELLNIAGVKSKRNDISALSDSDLLSIAGVKPKKKSFTQSPLKAQVSYQPTPDEIKYGLKQENLTPEYKAKIDKINAEKNTKNLKAKIGAGAMIASPLITLATGGLSLPAQIGMMGVEGGVFGLGSSLMNKGKIDAKEVAVNSALGAGIGGATNLALKGARKFAPQIKKTIQSVSKKPTIQEVATLATNPQKYVKDIKPKINPSEVVLDTVKPQKINKEFPVFKDNYLKNLSEHTHVLHREMSPDEALNFIGNRGTDMSASELHFSNDPDLALGQGNNKGIVIKLRSDGLQGKINTKKPTWKELYSQNKAEFIAKHNDQNLYKNNVESVTIKPNAKFSPVETKHFKNVLKDWSKTTNADGSITYTKPNLISGVNIPKENLTPLKTASTEGTKISNVSKSIDKTIGENIIPEIKYNPITNEETRQQVANLTNKEAQKIINSGSPSALKTMTMINKLKQSLSDVDNNASEAISDAIALQKHGTESGQSVQAFKEIGNLTHEGAVLAMAKIINKSTPEHARKLIDNADEIINTVNKADINKKAKALSTYFKDVPPLQRKSLIDKFIKLSNLGGLDNANFIDEISKKFKIPNLTPDDIKQSKVLTDTIQTATGREKDVAIGYLKNLLSSKKTVPFGEKVKAAKNINMLLSIPGRGVDVVSTALYQGQNALAELAAGRTLHPKAWFKGLKEGADLALDDIKKGIDTSRISATDAYDLPNTNVLSKVPIYKHAEKALNYAMRVPDRAFEEARYASSLAQQMKAAKVTEPTEEMLLNALEDAKSATFKNDSVSSYIAKKLQDTLNLKTFQDGKHYHGVGLGDFQIPFARTLGNIAEEGVKYTPLNYGTALTDYLQGNYRSAGMNLGKANIGTGLTAAGVGMGIANSMGAIPDYEIKANYQAQGQQPFSINTPIGNVQYSRLMPLANNLAFGQGMAQGWQSGDNIPSKIQGAIGGGLSSALLNQLQSPYVLGTKKLIDNLSRIGKEKDVSKQYGRITDTVKELGTNYAGQLLPFSGLANNINKANIPLISDKLQRQVDYTNPSEMAMSKYPYLSRLLPEKKSVIGESIKVNPTDMLVVSQLEGLLNGFNIEANKPNITIQKAIDMGKPLPLVEDRIKVNGKMRKLTSSEVSQYQELTGKINYDLTQNLFNNPEFTSLPEEEQVKVIQGIQKDANTAIKYHLFGNEPKNISNQAIEIYEKYLQ